MNLVSPSERTTGGRFIALPGVVEGDGEGEVVLSVDVPGPLDGSGASESS